MGVLNVTPDSFSDGGLWLEPSNAVAHARAMVELGADIIDVGGESTRPGAVPVPKDEELRRVLPVIEALHAEVDVPLSIDTRKPSVARRCVEAGAAIINDTLGEEADRTMDRVAAETGAAVVVMHSRGTPVSMQQLTSYRDVASDVTSWLRTRSGELEAAGVAPESIVVDPGFGFAKSAAQNLELLRNLDILVDLGYPVLMGTSRKSFIGLVLDLPSEERVEGTVATIAWGVMKGARLVRVHDVGPAVRAVRMIEAISTPSLLQESDR